MKKSKNWWENRILVKMAKEFKIEEIIEDGKEIEKRKKRVLGLFKKTNWLTIGLLIVLLILNVYIRTLPMRTLEGTDHPGLWDVTKNTWTLGPDLDPFLFLRYAKNIVEDGSLMKIDYMRYVPLGFDTYRETRILPYMIASLHNFINFF